MLRTLICHKEMVREKMGYAQMEVGFKEESSRRNRVQGLEVCQSGKQGKGNTRREKGKSCGAKTGIKEKEAYRDPLYKREKKTLRLQK